MKSDSNPKLPFSIMISVESLEGKPQIWTFLYVPINLFIWESHTKKGQMFDRQHFNHDVRSLLYTAPSFFLHLKRRRSRVLKRPLMGREKRPFCRRWQEQVWKVPTHRLTLVSFTHKNMSKTFLYSSSSVRTPIFRLFLANSYKIVSLVNITKRVEEGRRFFFWFQLLNGKYWISRQNCYNGLKVA